jgi:hypothetical protein
VYCGTSFDFNHSSDYDIQVIECKGKFQNIHKVPTEKVELLRAKYEPVKFEEFQYE